MGPALVLLSQAAAASSWQRPVYGSFVRTVSSVLGSRGERYTEVFFYPVWASNSRAERPQRSRSSWLAAVHAARALHASVRASSAPSWVSPVRPLFRFRILCDGAKHFNLLGIILLHSGFKKAANHLSDWLHVKMEHFLNKILRIFNLGVQAEKITLFPVDTHLRSVMDTKKHPHQAQNPLLQPRRRAASLLRPREMLIPG